MTAKEAREIVYLAQKEETEAQYTEIKAMILEEAQKGQIGLYTTKDITIENYERLIKDGYSVSDSILVNSSYFTQIHWGLKKQNIET